MKKFFVYAATAILLFPACSGSLRQENKALRSEIEQRQQALVDKQEAELMSARDDLQRSDSLLAEITARHDELHQWVMENSSRLGDGDESVLQLNKLRAQKDSLAARCEVLTAIIRRILRLQREGLPGE